VAVKACHYNASKEIGGKQAKEIPSAYIFLWFPSTMKAEGSSRWVITVDVQLIIFAPLTIDGSWNSNLVRVILGIPALL
jgi:hypothetical protein